MLDIGRNWKETSDNSRCLHTYKPARPVLVDLRVFTAEPDPAPTQGQTLAVKAGGIDLWPRDPWLPAVQHASVRSRQGHWFAVVEVVLESPNGLGKLPVVQLVPFRAIQPRQG